MSSVDTSFGTAYGLPIKCNPDDPSSLITQVQQPEGNAQKKALLNKFKLKLNLATNANLQQTGTPGREESVQRQVQTAKTASLSDTRQQPASLIQSLLNFFGLSKKRYGLDHGVLAKSIALPCDTERAPTIIKTGEIEVTPSPSPRALRAVPDVDSPQSPTSTAAGERGLTIASEQAASRDSTTVPSPNALTPVLAPQKFLLPELDCEDFGKKCLVLDLDETLVHSSFKAVPGADFVIPVEIDNVVHSVYVLKRPGVDQFLERLADQFELVVFTASLAKYADPVLDSLDKTRAIKHRLFRESCINHKGNYVKDLSIIGRDLKSVVLIDNSPASYIFHPSNAIPITSWFNDPHDTELFDLIPFLEDLKHVDNVTFVLDQTKL